MIYHHLAPDPTDQTQARHYQTAEACFPLPAIKEAVHRYFLTLERANQPLVIILAERRALLDWKSNFSQCADSRQFTRHTPAVAWPDETDSCLENPPRSFPMRLWISFWRSRYSPPVACERFPGFWSRSGRPSLLHLWPVPFSTSPHP